jgi:acetyl-CoA carboxylase carboxyltransferase component
MAAYNSSCVGNLILRCGLRQYRSKGKLISAKLCVYAYTSLSPSSARGLSVSTLNSSIDPKSPQFKKSVHRMVDLLTALKNEEETIRQGGGAKAIESQHRKNRLTARERVAGLIDPGTHLFELSIFAAYEMYEEWGGAPSAGTITGLGRVSGRLFMIIANDATVKAGAFFPMTAKKVIRAQNIAIENRIPTIYLVDSAGVFLPLQEDVFPDTDDFGRVFRNNAVMSAQGIPQITAIMGMCVAGGAYLPVMCDHILMTEGSGLFLAGPALVQAAIGQKSTAEELGGAKMHAQISGTVDFREPDDESCLKRIRAIAEMPPSSKTDGVVPSTRTKHPNNVNTTPVSATTLSTMVA